MSVIVVQITGDSTFVQKFVLVIVKENIKALCRCNLLGESTGDRQIPLTKGSVTQKAFTCNEAIGIKVRWKHELLKQRDVVLNVTSLLNTLRPRQNGRNFPDDIFTWVFLNENVRISIKISLKFVPWGPINNIPSLVQIMAWQIMAPSHYLNQGWKVYWRIYASLGLNELSVCVCASKTTVVAYVLFSSKTRITNTCKYVMKMKHNIDSLLESTLTVVFLYYRYIL